MPSAAPDTDTLLDAAIVAARKSPNRVRRVGALLISADDRHRLSACNTFPHGAQDTESRHEGNGRLVWMEHAERNAIFAAARAGIRTEGATLATTFFPCLDCARAIVQSGVRHLHTLPPALDDPVWGESFIPSRTILEEGGVALYFSARDPAAVHASTMMARRPPAA